MTLLDSLLATLIAYIICVVGVGLAWGISEIVKRIKGKKG